MTNAQFVCGKAEDIIVDVFKNMPRKTKIIGIMDPPRAGLRKYKLGENNYSLGEIAFYTCVALRQNIIPAFNSVV